MRTAMPTGTQSFDGAAFFGGGGVYRERFDFD
jgi:hypothetical protein